METTIHSSVSLRPAIPLSAEARTLVAQTVAEGATPAELQRLLWLADTYGLNPLKNELWFIKQPAMQRVNGQWTYVRRPDGSLSYEGSRSLIMTSRDGYLKIARRHTDFHCLLSSEVRKGDHFALDAGRQEIVHRYGHTRGRIVGAWARCERHGQAPVICYVSFGEYHRPGNFAWTQYPAVMIKKVAEVVALKRAFAISGLVTKEEMAWNGPFSQNQPKPARTAPQAATEALYKLAAVRTLYQLEKHLQSLPQEVRNDKAFAEQCRLRR
ncbi:MAG: recombinase RecT, partial [Bacteroidetes bacterium]|nr:recombinase RecT [Bacteroidota bacterium]